MLSKDKVQELASQVRPFFHDREAIQIIYLFGSALKESSSKDLDFAVLCDERFAKSKDAFLKVLRWGSELESFLKPRMPRSRNVKRQTAGVRRKANIVLAIK